MRREDEDVSDERFGIAFYLALAELSWAMPCTVEAVKQAEEWLGDRPIELPPRLQGSLEDAIQYGRQFEIDEDLLRGLRDGTERERIAEVDLGSELDIPGEELGG